MILQVTSTIIITLPSQPFKDLSPPAQTHSNATYISLLGLNQFQFSERLLVKKKLCKQSRTLQVLILKQPGEINLGIRNFPKLEKPSDGSKAQYRY